jgi:hypothetical protein
MWSARNGFDDVVSLLLQKWADIHTIDNVRQTMSVTMTVIVHRTVIVQRAVQKTTRGHFQSLLNSTMTPSYRQIAPTGNKVNSNETQ